MKTLYCYGMRLRGYSPGCQPKNGLVDWKDCDSNMSPFKSLLYYERKLSKQELAAYELEYLQEVDTNA